MEKFKVGDRFKVPYPFSKSTYEEMDNDSEGVLFTTTPTWKVGPTSEEYGPEGDCWSVAEAVGTMVLTVVSLHKPGKYPMRVFFTRTWIAPDGKAFGKTKCRITTVPTFAALAAGYRHDFVLRGCKCDGCRWPFHDHRKQPMAQPEPVDAVDPIDGVVAGHPRATDRLSSTARDAREGRE